MNLKVINLGSGPNTKTGTPARTAGQWINDNFRDVGNAIDQLTRVDSIIENKGFSLVGDDLTINAGWEWVINSVDFTNPVAVVIANIALSATGKKRLVYVVPDASNSFTLVNGVETTGTPESPALPNGGIYVTYLEVTDTLIGVPQNPGDGLGNEKLINKGVANGYVPLGPDSKVPDIFLNLSQMQEITQIYTTGPQEFTLPKFAQILGVFINGIKIQEYTELSDTVVRVDLVLVPVVRVTFIYLVSLNTSSVPYYTRAQSNALLNNKVDKVAGERLLTAAEAVILGNTINSNTGDQDLSGLAPIASPNFTGIPLVPTASTGTSTTQAASTEFVMQNRGGTAKTKGSVNSTDASGLHAVLEFDLNDLNKGSDSYVVLPATTEVDKTVYVFAVGYSGFVGVKANQAGTARLSGNANGIDGADGSLFVYGRENYRFIHRGNGYWFYEKMHFLQENLIESIQNKSTNIVTDGGSDIKYPSAKAVKTYVDARVGTSGEWTPTASALSNLMSITPANAYWFKIGNFVTLNFSANMVLAASGLLSFELTVPTAYPIAFEDPNVGNGVLQNNGFTPVLCQSLSGGTKISVQSKATVSGSLNAMMHINLTYKTI